MKYIIEIKPEYEDKFKGVMILGAKDSNLFVDTIAVENLEELTSDYINEHYGQLQDDAYQKGFEDGKEVNDKGCKGCKYAGSLQGSSPCFNCSNYYKSNWMAKDDKIGVGDVVRAYNGIVFAVTKVNDFNQAIGFDGDGSTCRFDLNEVTKTGEHYNINEILGGLCDD